MFIDGGLTSALIRTKNPSDKDFSTVYIINLTLSVVFYFLLFFCAPVVADFYDQPLLKPLMRVVSLILIIGSVASVHGTLLTIRVDFKTKSYISIISAVVSGTVGIVCAYKGMGVWALVAQSIASASAITLLTLLFVRWMPRLVFSKESFKRLFSYSSKLLAASCISTIYDNAYPLVIGKKFTAADVGQYTRAGQFPGIANDTIVGALNRVAFPILSQVQDDNERLLRVYEKYIQLACFVIFPVLMILCGCARPLVAFLLTDKWLACVPLMQIICFSKLLNGVTVINLNLLYVKGRSDLVLRLEFIKKSIAFLIHVLQRHGHVLRTGALFSDCGLFEFVLHQADSGIHLLAADEVGSALLFHFPDCVGRSASVLPAHQQQCMGAGAYASRLPRHLLAYQQDGKPVCVHGGHGSGPV